MLATLRTFFEYLGGERDDVSLLHSARSRIFLRCAIWIVFIVLIYFFSGQSSKFIYIDF